jgi:imidazolonepropionase-like amidohydrolase
MPFLMELLKSIHEAGAIATVGSDTSPDLEGSIPGNLHRELELLVESGFSPLDALAAGTRSAGQVVDRMGRDGTFGTIAPGQRADLLLLASNPLANVSHTRERIGVMARGRWYTQDQLDAMVDTYIATYY